MGAANYVDLQFDSREKKCIEGKEHSYKSHEEWIETPDMKPDGGHWRNTMTCEHCGDNYGTNTTGCLTAKDKKHDHRESFSISETYVSHVVTCINCGQQFSVPVLYDGKRKVIAKSTGELNISDGIYQGIANKFLVKILANNHSKFGCPALEFEVNSDISKYGERVVRVEVVDKVASITTFI